MKLTKKQQEALKFANTHSTISLWDLSEIFESLQGLQLLNDKGLQFASTFWKMFINEKNGLKERK